MPRLSGCVLAKCVAMPCIAAMQCVAIATCCIAMQCVGPYVTGDNRVSYRLETFQLENSAVRHGEKHFPYSRKFSQIGNLTLVSFLHN